MRIIKKDELRFKKNFAQSGVYPPAFYDRWWRRCFPYFGWFLSSPFSDFAPDLSRQFYFDRNTKIQARNVWVHLVYKHNLHTALIDHQNLENFSKDAQRQSVIIQQCDLDRFNEFRPANYEPFEDTAPAQYCQLVDVLEICRSVCCCSVPNIRLFVYNLFDRNWISELEYNREIVKFQE